MPNTIKIKRGTKASLPTLAAGEPGLCTDTQELYIGDGAANVRLSAPEIEIAARVALFLAL